MPLRAAAICGLLAPVTFVCGFVLGGLAQPEAYSSVDDDLSDLGALTASSPWLYNQVGANLTGLLLVVLALGLWSSLGSGLVARIGSCALLVAGGGLFLDGLFRLDCRGIDAGCDNVSWHSSAHRIESGFTAAALFVAPLVLAFAFRRIREWRDLSLPTLLVAPAVVVTSVAVGSWGQGAGNLAATVVWLLWIALVSFRLLRISEGSRVRTAA
ncbi:MAG TPA: DUF998 domain-containing protein [Gaiellaceae bacterium]|nr:DUF998 domain-containing protein [Gaiellaceae bacterium]